MPDELQKHLKGTTRAAVEGALVTKELGFNEGTEKEAIYKLSDSSGYLHFPSEESTTGPFIRKDGTIAWTADQSVGENKFTNLKAIDFTDGSANMALSHSGGKYSLVGGSGTTAFDLTMDNIPLRILATGAGGSLELNGGDGGITIGAELPAKRLILLSLII